MTSATSALTPWPAPRNLTTYRPSSSASTSPGSDPPSRSGVTYRVASTARTRARLARAIGGNAARASPQAGPAAPRRGRQAVGVASAAVISSIAACSDGLTRAPPSRCAFATLPARSTTKRL